MRLRDGMPGEQVTGIEHPSAGPADAVLGDGDCTFRSLAVDFAATAGVLRAAAPRAAAHGRGAADVSTTAVDASTISLAR